MGRIKITSCRVMVINQPFSIGDIIFLEPLFRHFWNKNGEKPIVPVRDHLFWLAEYIESAQFIKMSQYPHDFFERTDVTDDYFPARFANQVYRGYDKNDHHDIENTMLDKYRLAGLPDSTWKDINLKFNDDKGVKLMNEAKLMRSSIVDFEYALINQYSQAGVRVIDHTKMGSCKQWIRMQTIPGYSPIDWHLAMQMAEENHHVSTCTFFIMQAIANKYHFDSPVFLYPRPNEDGLRGVSQLYPTYKLIRSK